MPRLPASVWPHLRELAGARHASPRGNTLPLEGQRFHASGPVGMRKVNAEHRRGPKRDRQDGWPWGGGQGPAPTGDGVQRTPCFLVTVCEQHRFRLRGAGDRHVVSRWSRYIGGGYPGFDEHFRVSFRGNDNSASRWHALQRSKILLLDEPSAPSTPDSLRRSDAADVGADRKTVLVTHDIDEGFSWPTGSRCSAPGPAGTSPRLAIDLEHPPLHRQDDGAVC